jgi:hypothetical protein
MLEFTLIYMPVYFLLLSLFALYCDYRRDKERRREGIQKRINDDN